MRFACLLLFVLLCSTVKADVTVKEYTEAKANPGMAEILSSHIKGLGEGFGWANADLELAGRPPLFCAPRNLALAAENYFDIIERKIAAAKSKYTQEKVEKLYIPMLLLHGLEETFPCNADGK